LYGRIISLREGVWVHEASLTPLIFIEGSVISQESEWSCIIMLGVSILPFSMILNYSNNTNKMSINITYFLRDEFQKQLRN
jgi:hypothetical protein